MPSGAGARHSEYPIHTEVMRARPDVGSVIHTHSPAAVAFGAVGVPLRAISHEANLFVPPELAAVAYDDAALPIGEDQTISQPFIVAAMCELLSLDGTETVLDVGTGSGYAAAVLDELARHVVSVERIPNLAARAARALDLTGHADVEVRIIDDANDDALRPLADQLDPSRSRSPSLQRSSRRQEQWNLLPVLRRLSLSQS